MIRPHQLLNAVLGALVGYLAAEAVRSMTTTALPGLATALPYSVGASTWLMLKQLVPRRGRHQQAPHRCPCPVDYGYRTELISLDPLLIYIHNFVSGEEARRVIQAGQDQLQPSPVTGYGGDAAASQVRTSWSAPLPASDDENEAVGCVLRRAASFLGSTRLRPGREDNSDNGSDNGDNGDNMGPAQLVHYVASQKYDLHHDWFRQPRLAGADAAAGRRRLYNRAATFFVVLQADGVAGGETYFPHVRAAQAPSSDGAAVWRTHKDGGLAFRPIPGNALFRVNLLANGSGDARTLHAGLPVGKGTKTAMNIWPRVFFGPDA